MYAVCVYKEILIGLVFMCYLKSHCSFQRKFKWWFKTFFRFQTYLTSHVKHIQYTLSLYTSTRRTCVICMLSSLNIGICDCDDEHLGKYWFRLPFFHRALSVTACLCVCLVINIIMVAAFFIYAQKDTVWKV